MTTLVHAYHNVIEHETKRKMATHEVKASAFKALKDLLRRTMIRHTKSQRIQGAVALALPDEVCSTIFLDMTAAERRQYVDALNRPMKPATTRRLAEGGKTFGLEMDLALRRHVCSRGVTKLAALRQDLRKVRSGGEDIHAVVFTAFKDVHASVVAALKQDGFDVYEFSGGTDAKRRHEMIRDFQSSLFQTHSSMSSTSSSSSSSATDCEADSTKKAATKVFVITMRTGAVGITLTAASTVYLMEPCLDPSTEMQAAGRIHRLGQTKQVLVKRFVFRSTIEEMVCIAHKKITEGEVAITDSVFPAELVKLLTSK